MRLKSTIFTLLFLGIFSFSHAQTALTAYTEAGKVQATYYTSGEMTERIIYFENGAISEIATFKGNLPHGTWTYFNEAGKVLKTSHYNAGEKQGVWKVWSEFSGHFIEIDYTQDGSMASTIQSKSRFE